MWSPNLSRRVRGNARSLQPVGDAVEGEEYVHTRRIPVVFTAAPGEAVAVSLNSIEVASGGVAMPNLQLGSDGLFPAQSFAAQSPPNSSNLISSPPIVPSAAVQPTINPALIALVILGITYVSKA